jgi:hypothetical protein
MGVKLGSIYAVYRLKEAQDLARRNIVEYFHYISETELNINSL